MRWFKTEAHKRAAYEKELYKAEKAKLLERIDVMVEKSPAPWAPHTMIAGPVPSGWNSGVHVNGTHCIETLIGVPAGKVAVPTLTNMQLLAIRMGWKYLPPDKFHTIEVRKMSDEIYVWIITHSSESITLKDEAANFPSDELCSKLRLIEG